MEHFKAQDIYGNSFRGLIGVSKRDITPPLGIRNKNWGASSTQVAAGIHRRLALTCMVLKAANEQNSAPMVLICADLGWWKTPNEERILRDALLARFNLPEANLLFCLSHTHAGPSLSIADSKFEGGHLIGPYLDDLQTQAGDAVEDALASSFDGILEWRYGYCDLAYDRDFYDEETERFVVGNNPFSTADPTLLIGRIIDSRQDIRAVIVNYACHPTTLGWANDQISPDYVGAARQMIEEKLGAELLFIQGASGDLAPALQYTADLSTADAHGLQLGYAVLSVLASFGDSETVLRLKGAVESGAPLAHWIHEKSQSSDQFRAYLTSINLPLKDLETSAELEQAWLKSTDPVEKERLWRRKGLRDAVGDTHEFECPIWIWKIGTVFIIGQPNEAYSSLQINLRKQFNPTPICIANIANGYIGYLPSASLYSKNIYSVWQTPFASQALEKLEAHILNEINRLNVKL